MSVRNSDTMSRSWHRVRAAGNARPLNGQPSHRVRGPEPERRCLRLPTVQGAIVSVPTMPSAPWVPASPAWTLHQKM